MAVMVVVEIVLGIISGRVLSFLAALFILAILGLWPASVCVRRIEDPELQEFGYLEHPGRETGHHAG